MYVYFLVGKENEISIAQTQIKQAEIRLMHVQGSCVVKLLHVHAHMYIVHIHV